MTVILNASSTSTLPSQPQGTVLLRVGAHLAWNNPNDPLSRYSTSQPLRMVLVEPQPNVFQRLQRLITLAPSPHGVKVETENVAVCASDTPDVTFYTLPSVDELTGEVRTSAGETRFFIHSAFSQVASTSLAHVLKHQWRMPKGRNISDLVVAVKVPCMSVATLLERHRLAPSERLIMTVDAEGQDLAILESAEATVGLSRFDLFQWEHMHVDRARHCDFVRRAVAAGFACDAGKSDAWCVRRSALTPSLALFKEGSCRVQQEPGALTRECAAIGARRRGSRDT